MHPFRLTRFVLPLAAVLVLACGGTGPGRTFAPLGPTAAPTAPASPSAAPSGSGAPAVTLEVQTTEANPLAFEPNELEAPANTVVQVNYLNDSSILHNIEFFAGSDNSAPLLGQTEQVTGPDNTQSTTFTTPAAGDYYFWCIVHGDTMSGTLHVTE